jgi:hypothetical protein
LDAGAEMGHVWGSRWDSLTLFTPAQYSGLPGMAFRRPAIPPEPVINVGQGISGYEAAFRDIYRQVGGKAVLGPPHGEVADYGPGAAQIFKGGPRGAPAVICALPGRRAIAVAAPVWDELAGMGGGPARGGGLAAVGFPVPENAADGNTATALIRADATDVSVDGGSWGAGHLIRPDSNARWSWEPVVRTDFNSWHSNRWSSPGPTDLQIRAIASLP